MGLKVPNEYDLHKVNAEIAQIAHERFLVTTLAITVFGVIGAWLIPKSTPNVGSDLGAFTFAGSILLTSSLFMLFLFSHLLRRMLRILSSYLLVTKKSSWEYDWRRYRKMKYFGYLKTQTIIFLVLGVISTVYPIILAGVYSLSLKPRGGLWVDIGVGLVYFLIVSAIGFWGLFDPESKVMEKWKKLNSSKTIDKPKNERP